ncbi:13853_t:CDS:2 [Acaulospora colombiana]|uniref:13853_t:CDS:1 n=1 Tax=Acaulospora colombiana TaxID=27376 RepID=A0ACA9LHR4_9GLOM|nr:13853_t:CDS:2 [Acaulospora colombiana]
MPKMNIQETRTQASLHSQAQKPLEKRKSIKNNQLGVMNSKNR